MPWLSRSRASLARALAIPLLSAGIAVVGGCDAVKALDGHRWHGTPLDPPGRRPAPRPHGPAGRAFDLAAERGRVVLVFFGYTRCPDVCPTTLADWVQVKRALGADTAQVRFVFVSVDPERDSPEAATTYARRFDPSFVGVAGTRDEIGVVTSAWGIAAMPEATADADGDADPHAEHGATAGRAAPAGATAGGPTLAHTAHTFLVDPAGRLRLLYPPATAPADVAADVRHLLDG
jgi:protein SCO1/2